jgi:hypothetical protein
VLAAASLAITIVPLLEWKGLEGFGMAVGVMAGVLLVARGYFLAKLFSGFGIFRHALRAMAPTVPAVAAVLLVRAVESSERTLGLAAMELALYLAVTAAATVMLERPLLSEAIGYLRRGPRRQVQAPA